MRKEELEANLAQGGDTPDLGPIEGYLHALATERELPALALAMCTIRIEESGPPLRTAVERAASGDDLTEDEVMLVFRGLHVLGAARDRQSWKLLLRLLSRPNDEIDYLLGDGITETLGNIAAGVFDGDVDALFQAISDRSKDEFVRNALLGAATFLTWEGRIERERMKHFLERFYEQRLADDWDHAWIGWIEAIALLGLRSLTPLVESAWRESRIPPNVMKLEHFEKDLAEAERAPGDIKRLKDAHLGYIDDVVDALSWAEYNDSADADAGDMVWEGAKADPMTPATNPWRHVGRNDPCPCGSGKKAKKCCLNS
jgi:hypothetical protein